MCHQVASSAAIELGDDDDPALVEAMLRIIYDDEVPMLTVTFTDTAASAAMVTMMSKKASQKQKRKTI